MVRGARAVGPWMLTPTVPAVISRFRHRAPPIPAPMCAFMHRARNHHVRVHRRLRDELRQRGRDRLRYRPTTIRPISIRRRFPFTTRTPTRTPARLITIRRRVRGRRAARSTARTAVWRRPAMRTTRTRVRMQRRCDLTDLTAAPGRSPRTTVDRSYAHGSACGSEAVVRGERPGAAVRSVDRTALCIRTVFGCTHSRPSPHRRTGRRSRRPAPRTVVEL